MAGEISPKMQGSNGNHVEKIMSLPFNKFPVVSPFCTQSLVIGDGVSLTNQTSCIIIGSQYPTGPAPSVSSGSSNSIIIGSGSGSYNPPSASSNCVMIGAVSAGSAAGSGSTIIGVGNNSGSSNQVIIGSGNTCQSGNAIVLGTGNTISGSNSYPIVIGSGMGNYSGYSYPMAIGQSATFGANYACAVGYSASAGGSSAIALGNGATANGTNSIAIGLSTTVSGSNAIGMGFGIVGGGSYFVGLGGNSYPNGNYTITVGYFSQATASNAIAIGGGTSATNAAVASGIQSIALGTTSKAALQGQFAYGNDALIGTSSRTSYVRVANQTTSNATTALWLDSTTATVDIVLQLNSMNYFCCIIVGKITGASDAATYKIEGAVQVGATKSTTALVGSPVTTGIGQTLGASSWGGVSVSTNSTAGSIRFSVSGAASTTIDWFGKCDLVELAY